VVAFVLVVAIVGVGAVVWVGSGSGSHHPATGSRNSPVAASQDATPAGAYTYRKEVCQSVDLSGVKALLPTTFSSGDSDDAPGVTNGGCAWMLGDHASSAGSGELDVLIALYREAAAAKHDYPIQTQASVEHVKASGIGLMNAAAARVTNGPAELGGAWQEGVEFDATSGPGNLGTVLVIHDQNVLVEVDFTITGTSASAAQMTDAAKDVVSSVLKALAR